MQLHQPCTQAEFGELLGITQQAVSGMVASGTLIPGDTLKGWLQKYTAHLREKAAGRDSELSRQRALDTEVSRKIKEIKLAEKMRESIHVGVIDMVLASVGRKVSAKLEQLPGNLRRLCPELSPAAVALMQREIAAACDMAVVASLAMLSDPDEPDESEEGEEAGQGDAAPDEGCA
jgi:phage terminase Nu1 subunit (DNA packaging protein)